MKQNYTAITINALLSTSEKKRICALSALSCLMSVQQRNNDSQIWPITTIRYWVIYLKFSSINIFAPFSSNCKSQPHKKMFLLIQPGRKVSSYATELNCIITTCRVNQSVYNNRKIQAILHDNSDLSDVSF